MSESAQHLDAGSPRVSFVVPTKNSAATIEACLRSLRSQTYPNVEVVVVDNSSADATSEIARALADQVHQIGPERSAQRNHGAAQATGEFLVFIDSDMIVPPTVAAEIVEGFHASASAALVLPERSTGQGFWSRCKILEKELYLGDPDVEAARAFRRAEFELAGGYDVRINGGGEDWDLPDRIEKAGGKLGRTTSAVIHQEGNLSLGTTLRKKFYYGRTITLYARKHPAKFGRRVARRSLTRSLSRLGSEPGVVAGLLFMKVAELVAVLAGAVAARAGRAR